MDKNVRIVEIGFLLCLIITIIVIYINLYTLFSSNYDGYQNLPLSLFLIIVSFGGYCYLVNLFSIKQNNIEEKKTALIIPTVLMLMNLIVALILFLVANGYIYSTIEHKEEQFVKEMIPLWLVLLVICTAILVCFCIAKRKNIYLWYPMSSFCAVYASPAIFLKDDEDSSMCFIVLSFGIFFFSIIEYGIMLYINRKTWYIPKADKESGSANENSVKG